MNQVLTAMMSRYACKSIADYNNALKEIIQEIALLGLWRSKFFEKAAFYGGTCLRIMYGLDRFSEDLDFSLLKPDKHFTFIKYLKGVQNELAAFGFHTTVETKKKTKITSIDSAFIKAGTREQLLTIDVPKKWVERVHSGHVLKIKLEVDIDPPLDFATEAKTLLLPIPFGVVCYASPDLFSGKLHAVLCRPWKNRV